MKSPIILATLFAGSSLAAVPQPVVPQPDIGIPPPPLPRHCMVAEAAIAGGLKVVRSMLPEHPYSEPAMAAGVKTFRYEIGCGQAPPEAKAPPAEEQMDCSGKVQDAITKGSSVLRAGFKLCAPVGYSKGVEKGIKDFKKVLGCEDKMEIMVRDIEPPQCEPEITTK